MRVAKADPAAGRQAAGGGVGAGGGFGAGDGGDIEIALLNPNGYTEISARRLRPWLERLLEELLAERSGPADARGLGVCFAGDRAMRRANREFRGKDQTTDVLSFPGDGDSDSGGHLGDVLISVPQARRQAAAAGRDPEREIQVLLLHGVLHCLGHDHEVDGGEMERLERRLRRRWIGAPAGATGDIGAHPRGHGRSHGPGSSRRAARRAG